MSTRSNEPIGLPSPEAIAERAQSLGVAPGSIEATPERISLTVASYQFDEALKGFLATEAKRHGVTQQAFLMGLLTSVRDNPARSNEAAVLAEEWDARLRKQRRLA